MSKFTLNGKTYFAKKFTFNMICDMDEMGIDVDRAMQRPLILARVYIAICGGITLEEAGNEIEKHMISGGTMDEIGEVIKKEVVESDFFRSMYGLEKETQETQEEQGKTPKKSTKKAE